MTVATATRLAYDEAFERARALQYASIDAFEAEHGFALEAARYEPAARVLACPLKANPPHWQHGRVIYAATRRFLTDLGPSGFVNILDIGTAKGFSALCLHWALEDSGRIGQVTSVDVIDPEARVSRNTVAEIDGPLTLRETLAPWPESEAIHFARATGLEWLQAHPDPIRVAFVDGKHDGTVVRQEGKLLAARQEPGDLAIFDDLQIPTVSVAVVSLGEFYKLAFLEAGPRQYAIGRRR